MKQECTCPVCYGRGCVESTDVTLTCPDCQGSGLVADTHPALPRNHPCWICGKLKGQPPDRCPGHYML